MAHAQCVTDLNGDGSRDGVDLSLMLSNWGTAAGDCNGDGNTDGADLALLLVGWRPCPGPSWGTVLEQLPDPAVVTDTAIRDRIVLTGLPWRVRDNATNIEMLLVPPGTFWMGASPEDTEDEGNESPQHLVQLTGAFYLGRYEVTQSQYQGAIGTNPSAFVGFANSPNRPVENVSWDMAQGFCAATGMRLATEAEWEYACRAGTTTPRYNALNSIAWYWATSYSSGQHATHVVGGMIPNALGLFDMIGNVWEWTADWAGDYSPAFVTDPTGPAHWNLPNHARWSMAKRLCCLPRF